MNLLMRSLIVPTVAILLVPLTGCEILQALLAQEFEVPVELESPEVDLDASGPVDDAEASMCDDMDSRNCLIVQALDLSDDEEVSDPPTIPDEFPVSVEITDPVTNTTETVDVEEWIGEEGLTEDLDLAQVIPIDLTGEVAVQSPDAIQQVNFRDVALNWTENTLTFDTVDLDLFVSETAFDATDDPAELIANGDVVKVGTIPAQEAGLVGEAPVSFVEGGNQAFNDALKALNFTVVVALPEDADVSLKQGSEANLRVKPYGIGTVSLKALITYTISGTQVAEQVDDATGDEG